jgi:hypothetical protein
MLATSNVSASDPAVVDAYWQMVETLVFGKQPAAQRSDEAESGPGKPANRPRVAARVKNG